MDRSRKPQDIVNKFMEPFVTNQETKYHLSLAGEFFVAAELQRRGISAAVTYGNAKKADVVAFSTTGEKAVVIEVKCTSQTRWVVGGVVPPPSSKPWVFVYVPKDEFEAPIFYILLQSELHDLLAPGDKKYRSRFKEKWGEEYGDRRGVVNLNRAEAKPFHNGWERKGWERIKSLLG